MKLLTVIAAIIVIIGALNWGLVGIFKYDLVAAIAGKNFGETNGFSRTIYVIVGLAGLVLLAYLPRLWRERY